MTYKLQPKVTEIPFRRRVGESGESLADLDKITPFPPRPTTMKLISWNIDTSQLGCKEIFLSLSSIARVNSVIICLQGVDAGAYESLVARDWVKTNFNIAPASADGLERTSGNVILVPFTLPIDMFYAITLPPSKQQAALFVDIPCQNGKDFAKIAIGSVYLTSGLKEVTVRQTGHVKNTLTERDGGIIVGNITKEQFDLVDASPALKGTKVLYTGSGTLFTINNVVSNSDLKVGINRTDSQVGLVCDLYIPYST